jgi:hypothetical protein
MKVYFTASIAGKKNFESQYKSIVDALQKLNCDVISDHILKENRERILHESKEERLAFQKQLENWITQADCMVVETSFPSISVGYEISLAQRFGKPILILYSEGDAPSLLAHHHDEKLICERYTPSSLHGLLSDFINFVKGVHDSRFTFFITPRIARYLEKVSKEKKLPKSVYLRNLIEAEML